MNVSCGMEHAFVEDVKGSCETAIEKGFSFVVYPAEHDGQVLLDLDVSSNMWADHVVLKLKDYNVDAHPECEKLITDQLSWALHVNVAAIIVPLVSINCANLASVTSPFMHSRSNIAFWIQLKSSSTEEDSSENPWHVWNRFRKFSPPCTRLGIALELCADVCSEDQQDRWLGEPVKSVIISTDIFLTNKKGFPVLSRAHQKFIKKLLKLQVQFLLTSTNDETDLSSYLRYLNHLVTASSVKTLYEKMTTGYNDYIEIPLQPLMDHLESQTYETFEADPVKYEMYEKAIFAALKDRQGKKLTLMVVGAGRGPLVKRALSAIDNANADVTVYALEKNPGAVKVLNHLKEKEWGNRVTVYAGDMRTWNSPEKADIIVSELLGSWGDNELSPECLDGTERFMKDDAISIPCKYTSYVAPVCAHKVHTELKAHTNSHKNLQTPYVVLLKNFYQIGNIKPLFIFNHAPNVPVDAEGEKDNTRQQTLTFTAAMDSTLNGFIGYFDSDLYKDIAISIHPETHSRDMFSWFPMYIPLEECVSLKKGDTIEACFWRKTANQKVWYEWCIISPQASIIHNLGGKHSFVGL
eukprot:m.94813 g.94813  ORF g.94813 m.94813 type:complete len:580 (-) comp8931_c1_seq5:143-1882(-)